LKSPSHGRNGLWVREHVDQIDGKQFAAFALVDTASSKQFNQKLASHVLLHDAPNFNILLALPIFSGDLLRMKENLFWYPYPMLGVETPTVTVLSALAVIAMEMSLPIEGHVHRLKLLKRQMHGKASFETLRKQVLRCGWAVPLKGGSHPNHQLCGRPLCIEWTHVRAVYTRPGLDAVGTFARTVWSPSSPTIVPSSVHHWQKTLCYPSLPRRLRTFTTKGGNFLAPYGFPDFESKNA
jgi:hypothetical protein